MPSALSVETIARQMFDTLVRTFPVACASDEFYYFPQVRPANPHWSTWDQFSPEIIEDITRQLSGWEHELDRLASQAGEDERQAEITLLQQTALTLREQLTVVRTWESQPSFALTIACLGLAEAFAAEDPAAKYDRAATLPEFLIQASRHMQHVPALFRDIGLEMVADTRRYFLSLEPTLPELQPALSALDRFEERLRTVSTREAFWLPSELLERVFQVHLRYEMTLQEITEMLDLEIAEMQHVMEQEARALNPDLPSGHADWAQVLRSLPMPMIGEEGLLGLYRAEVERLAQHCLDHGLISSEFITTCPVHVAPVPAFLSAIRTASSYSIPPKHPPEGGIFYINNAEKPEEIQQRYLREYPMLTAHETYPGHHLLDSCRWSLAHPVRRVIESPLFYEGWACFAEEIMRITGYFSAPADRLLLAKRRYWRAVRGKVDVGLQTGTLSLPAAAHDLSHTGVPLKQADSLVRKYPLNPGYKVCYTLGVRRFVDLFHHYGQDKIHPFIHTVLGQGEIRFQDLEIILQRLAK
ncbi:DUF885 family protein [candidate division KSB3 bacterium]|uniref:DUF885 family protein n=1 Tax=candidate division KSB3 bacterium TaxID=2044937 RepID=A0A9D5Q4M6_9BACT|nr:DUF885 family protein [candidate division KSB3 bacterium]MBD3323443.1 DUF885 family protein [candidate division KSB3 bacterium]